MIFESAHLRVIVESGTATLWIGFPGRPVNGLNLERLHELDTALVAIEANRFIERVVVRSSNPSGFCAGLHPQAIASLSTPARRAEFAGYGQSVLARLGALDATTVALIDGDCWGAGLELAMACDFRLCLASPTTRLGFPDAPAGILPAFGGTSRLREICGAMGADDLLSSSQLLSGREARRLGLVDHAFCDRRAKIELRSFFDRLEQGRLGKPRRLPNQADLPDERRRFAAAITTEPAPAVTPIGPTSPMPEVVGLVGDDAAFAALGVEALFRGCRTVLTENPFPVIAGLTSLRRRGFLTALEEDETIKRVRVLGDLSPLKKAGLVFVSDLDLLDAVLTTTRRLCVIAVPEIGSSAVADPRVVGIAIRGRTVHLQGSAWTRREALRTAAGWVDQLGCRIESGADAPAGSLSAAA